MDNGVSDQKVHPPRGVPGRGLKTALRRSCRPWGPWGPSAERPARVFPQGYPQNPGITEVIHGYFTTLLLFRYPVVSPIWSPVVFPIVIRPRLWITFSPPPINTNPSSSLASPRFAAFAGLPWPTNKGVAPRARPSQNHPIPEVAAIWVDQETSGESTVTKIELDRYGRPTGGWPTNTF